MAKKITIPEHIGFIMDGNGRWAKARLLPRKFGHREGTKALERVIEACYKFGIKAVSFYAFSTENWSRPQDEIDALFGMIKKFTDKKLPKLIEKNIVVTFMGDLTKLPEDVRDNIKKVNESCKYNTGMVVNIALNYGGQDEIVYAVRNIVKEGVTLDKITKETINSHLYTGKLPNLDLLVRSSGEVRLSNFMLWQVAYAELMFVPDYWPDFDEKIIKRLIEDYSKRNRRYGGL